MALMSQNKLAPMVVRLGGSILFNNAEVATELLGALRDLFVLVGGAGQRLLVVVGGGRVCRQFQQAGRAVGISDAAELDRIGLAVIRAQAELVRASCGALAQPNILQSFDDLIDWSRPIVVSGGTAPGWSTDYVASVWASKVGAATIVKGSNIAYVYEGDPRVNPQAQPQKRLTWPQYRQLIAKNWEPGMSTPFDPVAAEYSQDKGLAVNFFEARNLKAFTAALSGQPFEGTIISNAS